MAANPELQAQISALPHKPGVYKYFDDEGVVGGLVFAGDAGGVAVADL